MPVLSDTDISIVKNMMLSKPLKEIAFVLDRPVDEVLACIKALVADDAGIVTYQQKADKKRAARPSRMSPVVKHAKEESVRERERVKAIKKNVEIEKSQRSRRHYSEFKTKAVDYSQLVLIKVDEKTYVYARPGEEKQAKIDYLKKYKKTI